MNAAWGMLYESQNPRRFNRHCLFPRLSRVLLAAIVLAVIAILASFELSAAQSSSFVYWRYDAPDRLSRINVADIDQDGIDDLVVVAGDGDVILVGADGIARWSVPYKTTAPVVGIATFNLHGEMEPTNEILLLTEAGLIALDSEGNELFATSLREIPTAVSPVGTSSSEQNNVLVALANGELRQIDNEGRLVWRHVFQDVNSQNAQPVLVTADLNRDGQDEIIYSYFTDGGFSKLALISPGGELIWERSNSGSISAMTIVEFDAEQPLEIALGTSLNRVYLYTADGQRRWPYRSPNKPITSLETAVLDGTPALVVGTSVGKLIAYDDLGRRIWAGTYSDSPDNPILSISSSSEVQSGGNPVALAIVIGQPSGSTEASDIILLDGGGRRLEPSFPAVDNAALSGLVDVNHDGISELLLAGFATAELLDPGIGARQYSSAWDYRLGAGSQAFLVTDIDQDGEQEILIGTDGGTLHALNNNGALIWAAELGGVVSDIAIAQPDTGSQPAIVAVHNDSTISDNGVVTLEGFLELLDPDGNQLWSKSLPSTITAMTVGDINRSGPPEIIVGTSDGLIIAFSLTGDEFWRSTISASVDTLTLSSDGRGVDILASTGANTIDRFDNKGTGFVRTAEYLEEIVDIYDLTRDPELVPVLVVAVEDGTLRGISLLGNQLWQVDLPGSPIVTIPADNSVIVGTDEDQLLRIDINGEVVWRQNDPGRVTSLYWGDLDGNIQADIAVGNREGDVLLITGDGEKTWDQLNLDSEVVNVSAIRRLPNLQADLVAVTDNGIVQLFQSQANRPPLLVNPRTDVGEGSYSISVSVIDVENDPVIVGLDLYDPDNDQWIFQGEKTASGGRSTIFWPVDPPEDAQEVRYRFQYDDGSHSATVEPAAGPAAIPPSPILLDVIITLVFGIVGIGGAALYIRQARSPIARARRYYARLKQKPELTLAMFDDEYNRTDGSPYFLLNLANAARQDRNLAITSLADGLYLLDSRPESALRIIVGALEDAEKERPEWLGLDGWLFLYRTALSLITAPSITELTLLKPQFEQLLKVEGSHVPNVQSMDRLLPVLTTLRDSERVDLVEDRLVYLNESIGLLKQFQHQSVQYPVEISNTILAAIVSRWLGLVRVEVEEMHGRAQLVIQLMTKHLVPEEEPIVALEIANKGRAPAEQVVVTLQANPGYSKVTKSQLIPILSPGRKRQVQFAIDPDVREPFRIVFSIIYDDRQSEGQMIAFADMVYLLPPIRDFKPILNPYSPGMPLRQNSQVFYGREDLFQFIRDNAGRGNQRNVLILIGQRRTGKTSVLLQLDQHLPEDQFPIFIDCQSLGVSPGMPAFFHDLAWTMAESLAAKGMEISVPKSSEWQTDPAGKFQRQFIPAVQNLLPDGTKILLVFDEFEAFENLVRDNILPQTLFPFLRHIMQHREGLGFVFAGTHRLEEMGSDYWSVLFNIALYKHIGYLDNETAERLIRNPVAPNIIYDDLAIDKIMRVTSGHPYFLQLVCYSLVNRANKERKAYVTISDVNAALNEMLRLGEVHFAYLWQRSTFTERALLAAASRRVESDAAFQPVDLVHYLSQYGIFLDPAEVTAGLHRLVEREIMSEVSEEGTTYFELRIGLVGLWVAQNKSISKLYESQNVKDLIQPRAGPS
ncbi:MAG: AAA family ATPase [Candidatus Promineifilaceae bacterium]